MTEQEQLQAAVASLASKGIVLNAGGEFDVSTPVSFSLSFDGLEGSGKTYIIINTMPRPLVIVNFGDRSALQFLYKMSKEERQGIHTIDIQPTSPEGWTFSEAVESLKQLNTIVATMAPTMPGGTFALDGGSSWWSVMQQVFVEPKEQERLAAGKKQVGGIIYEEANNRVRGVIGHIRANGCFLAMTHQMKQNWDEHGPIIGSFSPKKNNQIPYLMEVEVTLMKLCSAKNQAGTECGAFACETAGHVGRKHVGRIKKLSGNTLLEGTQIEGLTFPIIYTMQTGLPYPTPEKLPLPMQAKLAAMMKKKTNA